MSERLREILSMTEIAGKPLPDGKQVADILAERLITAALKLDPKFTIHVLDRAYGVVQHAPDPGMVADVRTVLNTAYEEWRRNNPDALKKRGAGAVNINITTRGDHQNGEDADNGTP